MGLILCKKNGLQTCCSPLIEVFALPLLAVQTTKLKPDCMRSSTPYGDGYTSYHQTFTSDLFRQIIFESCEVSISQTKL